MNKKVNTALFILGATFLNMLIMVLLILLGLFIISLIFKDREMGAGGQIALIVVFAGGVIGAFFIYNKIIRIVANKVDMEKYFHPIIKPRKR
ncbi:MAG: leader peptide processing enzyme [Spirochaetales bacterium]|nr:leader peptide processing enzyme [Spirochaetales bacterium]